MNKLIFLILILGVVGCGRKSSSSSSSSKSSTNPVNTKNLEVTQKETVKFHRQELMVSRYDCDHKLTSRKLETQNVLRKKITIDYENRKNAWDYSVYNPRTKSKKKGFLKLDGNFTVDYAPTVFNMQVKQGINDIEYAFYTCKFEDVILDMNAPRGQKCSSPLIVEKEGIIQVDVYYSSEILPGEKHEYPIPKTCKKNNI